MLILSTGKREYLDCRIREPWIFFYPRHLGRRFLFLLDKEDGILKDGKKAEYDQQPIEASYMIQSLILAYKIVRDEKYKKYALQTFQWFIGKNTLESSYL